MTDEAQLREKLRKIEALFAGADTVGEKLAAEAALERVRARLAELERSDKLYNPRLDYDGQCPRESHDNPANDGFGLRAVKPCAFAHRFAASGLDRPASPSRRGFHVQLQERAALPARFDPTLSEGSHPDFHRLWRSI